MDRLVAEVHEHPAADVRTERSGEERRAAGRGGSLGQRQNRRRAGRHALRRRRAGRVLMLVEVEKAGDQQVAVERILARAAREAVVGDAFTPDLEVRGESARTTLDDARLPEGRQRLTAVGRRGAAGVTIIEGEGEDGRNGEAT